MSIQNYNSDELLRHIMESHNINMDAVLTDMNRIRKKELLSKHNYRIYQQKDGRWCTYIKGEGKRKAIRVNSLTELEDRLCDYYEKENVSKSKERITLSGLYEEWIEYKSKHVKKQSITVTKSVWNKYYKDSEIASIPIRDITKLMLDEWIHDSIRTHQMNKHKYTNFISIIKQELEYAVDKGIIGENPYAKVKVNTKRVLVPEIKKRDTEQVFTPNEEKKFKEMAFSDFTDTVYPVNQLVPIAALFLFYTGLRIGELCTLRFSDINGNYFTIKRFFNVSNHSVEHGLKAAHAERTIPLTDDAKIIIQMAKERQIEKGVFDEDSYVFSLNDKPLSYQATRELFYKYCKKMNTFQKGPHCARKTYISHLIDAGVNLNTIRKIVGHKDERTTLNNYCYDRRTEKDTYDSICKAFS